MKYIISSLSQKLIVSLDIEEGLYNEYILEFDQPSVVLQNDTVEIMEGGESLISIPFHHFGSINGELPTDINDAFYKLQEYINTLNSNIPGSIDTSFSALPYDETISIAYDADSPNKEITLEGNLNLTVIGTSNGDFGIVNIYSSASETITVNGLKGLSLNGNGSSQMIPISFVHSTDGIRWYDERESTRGDIDTSNLAESVGTTLWHDYVGISTGTVTSLGTDWAGTGTTFTNNIAGAKIFIGESSLIIDSVNTGAQTFTTTTALSSDVTNATFAIKFKAVKVNLDGSLEFFDANEGVRRELLTNDGTKEINGLVASRNGNVTVNGNVFTHDQIELYQNNVNAPTFGNRVIYTASSLPTFSSTQRIYASVSDADNPTYHGILQGGGNVNCIVYWNGLNWIT